MIPQPPLSPLVRLLTCLECHARVEIVEVTSKPGYPELGADGWLACPSCGRRYPVIGGTPRMLDLDGRSRLASEYPAASIALDGDFRLSVGQSKSTTRRTAESFAYEWSHFGRLRSEWRKNFLDYMQPLAPDSLASKLVLDVGTGSGRHSVQASALGANVVAIDVGRSIDVARRNLPSEVLTVQADANRLPFSPETFDIVMSIGVLHHLPHTERAISRLVSLVTPGGHLHLYLYWVPERRWHQRVLRLVTASRRFTVRLPHRVLHQLCYPISAVLWLWVVAPYRLLRRFRRTAGLADAFPLKTYADYPFAVLVNDQFDRFSAPIEQRFTKAQVHAMLKQAGLNDVVVVPNSGWVADGRRPSAR